MTKPILVRGEVPSWMITGRILGALVVLVGLVLLGVLGWLGGIVTGVGLLAWAWPEYASWQARRARTWLTLHEDGFEVEDRSGHRAYHDSQVSAAALETKKNLNNGVLASVTRQFTLWIDNSPEPIQMENRINVGATDPLAGLINRLMERLSERFRSSLAGGGTVRATVGILAARR